MSLAGVRNFNAEFYRECAEFSCAFEELFLSQDPVNLIRNLKFSKRLFELFPELAPMNRIYQDKKANHCLFDHSLVVLAHTYKKTQYKNTLMAAFLHDYGKIFTSETKFKAHDEIGVKKIVPFLEKYGVKSEDIAEIKKMMRTHTRASQYQREQNWTDEAIKRFIRDTHPLTMEIIAIAEADKKASHDYELYLKPYEDLRKKCLEQFKYYIEL